MSDKTPYLELEKPENGEYLDNWDQPINDNFDILDDVVGGLRSEVMSARGNLASLSARLDGAIDADGSLQATPEVVAARVSQIGASHYTSLYDRCHGLDMEILAARGQKASLVDALTTLSNEFSTPGPIEGPKTGNGDATFLTFAGAVVTIDGTPTPVVFNINGRKQIVRIDATVDLTGQATGTYFIKAEVGSGRTVESGTGVASVGGTDLDTLTDATAEFVTKGVIAGDMLTIPGGDNEGTYVVKEVVDETNLKIYGKFNVLLSSLDYTIMDMLHPTVSYALSKEAGSVYVGEVAFDGVGVTDGFAYNYKGKYSSPFTAIDVSSVAIFTQTFNHNLGELPHAIQIYASQTSDGEPSEPLSVAEVASDYALGFTDGGDGDTFSPTGGPYMTRSVKIQVSRRQIVIKNVRDNHFYKDFSDNNQDTGYIKVICRR